MLNQKIIRELFNLEPDEAVFDDFTCNHDMKPGKLYVMENHLCFYTTFLRETKLVLKFKDIEEITKTKSCIKVKAGLQTYEFSKFEDLLVTYTCIQTSWAACYPEKATNGTTKGEAETPASTPQEETVNNQEPKTTPGGPLKTTPKIVEETKKNAVPTQNGTYVEMDNPQAIMKSLELHQKREHEYLRFVFGFTVEECYKRFVAEGCVYPDTANLELMGSKDFDDKGWQDVEGVPGRKTRILTLQYKLEKSFIVSTAYTIKDITLDYTE